MKTYEFILRCIGCYVSACKYMDYLQKSFDIELTENDIQEVLANYRSLHNIGNELIGKLYDKIVEKAQEAHPECANELPDLFQYYCNDYASSLLFNGEYVTTWDYLEKTIKTWKANRKEDNDYDL